MDCDFNELSILYKTAVYIGLFVCIIIADIHRIVLAAYIISVLHTNFDISKALVFIGYCGCIPFFIVLIAFILSFFLRNDSIHL